MGFFSNLFGKRVEQGELIEAATEGDIQLMQKLFNRGADVNEHYDNGVTALFMAAGAGHTGIVEELLSRGANPNAVTETGDTPLGMACEQGHTEIVKKLLEHGAYWDVPGLLGVTPLMHASKKGNIGIVELLLNKDADPRAKARDKATPLILASGNGHVELVKLLIRNGARINSKTIDGRKAVDIARERGYDEVCEIIAKSKGTTYFPKAMNVRFKELNNFTYPLMLNVCRARGLDTTDVTSLFSTRCPACNAIFDSYTVMRIGDLLESGIEKVATPVPQKCPQCGSNEIRVLFSKLSESEEEALIENNLFANLSYFKQ